MQEVTPDVLMNELLINARAGLNSMVWGPPGIGKSQIAYQVGEALGAKVFELRANLFDPIDVRGGLKVVEQEDGTYKTRYGIPEDYPESDTDEPIVLLVDELPNAPKATQNALLQLLLDRKIGQYTLPKNTTIIAAGNRAIDRAAVHDMPTPVANRFSHYVLATKPEDWVKWAHRSNIDPGLISFIRYRPQLLHDMDVKAKAFPTPRSWDFVNSRMAAHGQPSADFNGVSSLVGEGAATEFCAFMRVADSLPDIDQLIANPKGAEVPTDMSVIYALTGALISRSTSDNFESIMQFVSRLPIEYQVAFVRDAVTRDETLIETDAFTEFAEGNADVLL